MDRRFPKLKNRLLCLAAMVTPGARVADIGCDHGYLSIYLLREGIAASVVGVDLSPDSVEKARKNIERFGFGRKIALCCADGLKELDISEIDTIVIAGLGGEMIAHILAGGRERLPGKTLLLSPMRREEKLREYLYQNGFDIEREVLCQDEHRVHTVIQARKNRQTGTDRENAADYGARMCYLGKISPDDPLLPDYLRPRARHLQQMLSHQARHDLTPAAKQEQEQAAAALTIMRAMLEKETEK